MLDGYAFAVTDRGCVQLAAGLARAACAAGRSVTTWGQVGVGARGQGALQAGVVLVLRQAGQRYRQC